MASVMASLVAAGFQLKGKKSEADPTRMQPNENYLKYFPDEDILEAVRKSRISVVVSLGGPDDYLLPR